MPTAKFFLWGKTAKILPVYVRLSAGRGSVFVVPTGIKVRREIWDKTLETIEPQKANEWDRKIIETLSELKEMIEGESMNHIGEFTKAWLIEVICKYHLRKLRQVKTIEIIDGESRFNVASTASNDDWIRAARLLKEGKLSEFEKLDSEAMYFRPDSLIEEIQRNNSSTHKTKK